MRTRQGGKSIVYLISFLILNCMQMDIVGSQFSGSRVNISSRARLNTHVVDTQGYSCRLLRAMSYEYLTKDQRNNASLLGSVLDIYITWDWQGKIVEKIHGINPDVKVLIYRSMKVIKSFNPEWQTALNNGWLLRDSGGNLIHSTIWPNSHLADIANQEYRDFIVEWLNRHFDLYGFDGLFADCCLIVSVDQWTWDQTGKPVNPRTGELYTDEQIREDTISFIKYVKHRIGEKVWISNGINNGEVFARRYTSFVRVLREAPLDGFMSEGLLNLGGEMGRNQIYSESKWKKSLDFVSWVQDNFLNQAGRYYIPTSRCSRDQIPAVYTTKQVATFVFSSLLLAVTTPQNYLKLAGPLMDIQHLFEMDLGSPVGTYYMMNGTRVYSRDFTKVKVLVNPSDTPYSLDLDAEYETFEGQIVSSLLMQPHAGLILNRIV